MQHDKPATPRPLSTRQWIGIAIAAAVAWAIVGRACDGSARDSTGSSRQVVLPGNGTAEDAIANCQVFIARAAHDPGSIEWIRPWEWTAVPREYGSRRWNVGAQFRARTPAGGLKRSAAICVVDNDPYGNWTLVELAGGG